MRSLSTTVPRRRGRRTALAASALLAALALTATACGGSTEDKATDRPDASASTAGAGDDAGGGLRVPADLADRLKDHGIDVDKWRDGGWKDWDKDEWLREARDFVNPVIEGLWKPERMQDAEEAEKTVTTKDASADQGLSDPKPAPVTAQAEKTPYHENAAPVGQGLLRHPRGLVGLLRHGGQGRQPPGQVQPRVDRRATACTRAAAAAGTATSSSSRPTTTTARPRRS